MNILVTAIGSMASAITLKKLREQNPGIKLIAADIFPKEWLWQSSLADVCYRVPKAVDTNYVPVIFDICAENRVDYVIPLIDPEVDILSKNQQLFLNEGITICTSKSETVENCRDKLKLWNNFQSKNGFHTIPTYSDIDAAISTHDFPLVIKPKKGRSSAGVFKVNNILEVKDTILHSDEIIIQPYLEGKIFTVDVIRDVHGNIVSVPRKELIRSNIGAGLTVEIIENLELENISSMIANHLKITGAVNIEFIRHDGRFYLMDINPRFSAGIEFTVQSGYDIVNNQINAFRNLRIEPKNEIKKGIYYKTYQTFSFN
jgi:carbamoyl-phosphate synthase large subunit